MRNASIRKNDGEYTIGQSKKDDYGKVEIKAKKPKSPKRKVEYDTNTNLLYVWLLSDVLLRDNRLRPTADLNTFRETLQQKLGVVLKEYNNNADLISVSVRQRRTESWQVKWRLPRPSLAGMEAGSCLVYKVESKDNQPIDTNKLTATLKKIQITGIGERRAEGYGQICFNDRLLTSKLSELKPYHKEKESDDNSSKSDSPKKDGDKTIDDGYARLIEKQAWREAIQQKALALASNTKYRQKILGVTVENGESYPPMTQLGNLRSILSKLKYDYKKEEVKNKDKVETWIDSLKKRTNRYEKWGDARLKTVRQLVTDESQLWKFLSSPDYDNPIDFNQLTITKNGIKELKQELWAEAIRTLVDAVIRAHKRSLEEVSSKVSR